VTRAEVEAATQLRAIVGSTVHGLALDGTDDRDEMGVCLEPLRFAAGLASFETFTYRTAEERARASNTWPSDGGLPKSEPGDLDLSVHSLRKYVRLALNGNPSILLLLYVPPDQCLVRTPIGAQLQELAPAFISRRTAAAFLGYLTAQRERLMGLRGGKDVQRPDLEAAHGYDTKYAMHMVRLGYQGLELLSTGKITLPMPADARTFCRSIREGHERLVTVLERARDHEADLASWRVHAQLPERGDHQRVDRFLYETYGMWWSTEWWSARNERFSVARSGE
jgi:hypothetical protein